MRKELEKRFFYLWTGESVSLILFMMLSFVVNRAYPSLKLYSLFSFWVSFFLLEFLLVQGSMYWYAKWKRLKKENRSATPIGMVKILRILQKWNLGLIVVSPFIFIYDFFKWDSSLPIGGMILSGLIYLFAILEYINYFHIQLSYDSRADLKHLLRTKRLKQASLNKDFERNLKA
ncbi:general stress protein [Niallia sp. Krafla_26]|uniref:general stress protein n=1 Tax=Niallia sp. Krafla_26 TaxID=3064703 RepID=UPI003D172EAB